MKIQIEIELSDEEIEMLKKAEKDDFKTSIENIFLVKSLVNKDLIYEVHNSWGSFYGVNRIGCMILEKLNANRIST